MVRRCHGSIIPGASLHFRLVLKQYWWACYAADYMMHSLCKAHTCHLATHRQMLRKIVKVRTTLMTTRGHHFLQE